MFAENIYFIYKATHYIRKLLQYFCLGRIHRDRTRQANLYDKMITRVILFLSIRAIVSYHQEWPYQ